jgi:hypothetical protein
MRQHRSELAGFLRRLPIALAAAVIVWLVAKPYYNEAICWTAQGLARLIEYPRAALILVQADDAMLGRSDLRTGSGWLKTPLTQVHFNLVPFLALVLAVPRPFAGGGWRRISIALGVLAAAHVLSIFLQYKVFCAFSMGAWSRANYSDLGRNVWGTLRYFFDIPVTFALPLLAWVAALPDKVFALLGIDNPA